MLFKRFYILKGNSTVKSVLKISLYENSHADIEFQSHLPFSENLTFILKSGTYTYIEQLQTINFKKKLPPFSLNNLCACISKNGKILAWTSPTPNIPYCLVELANKYLAPKIEDKQQIIEFVPQDKQQTNKISLNEENQSNSEPPNEPIQEETTSLNTNFDILDIEYNSNTQEDTKLDSSNYENLLIAKEIEEKYSTLAHNEELEKIFPDSKWIMQDDNDFSLGILYNSTKITHICYAKRGENENPFDKEASYYSGWWIVYNNID